MNSQKKLFARQAFTVTVLVGLLIFLNSCNVLKGEGIRLWGGDDDRKASTSQPPQKQGNKPAASGDAAVPCTPNLSKGTLKSDDPKLKDLKEQILKLESDRTLNGPRLYKELAGFVETRQLKLTEPEVKRLARNIINRSREQIVAPSPSPLPSATPAPSSTPGPRAPEPEVISVESTTPPAVAQHAFHRSIVALVAYQNVIDFALSDRKDGMGYKERAQAAQIGSDFLNNKSVKEPDTAFVGTYHAFQQAFDELAHGKDVETARTFIAQIIADKRYNGFTALIAWVNTFKYELNNMALDRAEALENANKAICYQPGATTSHSQ